MSAMEENREITEENLIRCKLSIRKFTIFLPFFPTLSPIKYE